MALELFHGIYALNQIIAYVYVLAFILPRILFVQFHGSIYSE